MIYLFILILLLCLTLRYDINGKTKYRSQWYIIMLVIFILVAGLRWRLMVDTPNYIERFYHRTPLLKDYSFDIGKAPFYTLINSIVLTLGGRFYVVQLIEASFVNILVFKYFKRHSKYIFTCLFFYYIMCYTGLSMETMKASFSVVLCLYANDYILDKKWIKGYVLFIIAFMFHAQTLVMFVLPLMFFLRLNKTGGIILLCGFFIGVFLNVSLGDYVMYFDFDDAIEDKVSGYAESDRFGGAKDSMTSLITQILMILYSIVSILVLRKHGQNSSLLRLERFVMLGLFFSMIRFNFDIAYRFLDYFRIHIILFYSEFMMLMIMRAKKLDKYVACVRAFVAFIPFFFFVGLGKYNKRHTLFPYSSVINRKIDSYREAKYFQSDRPGPNIDEY